MRFETIHPVGTAFRGTVVKSDPPTDYGQGLRIKWYFRSEHGCATVFQDAIENPERYYGQPVTYDVQHLDKHTGIVADAYNVDIEEPVEMFPDINYMQEPVEVFPVDILPDYGLSQSKNTPPVSNTPVPNGCLHPNTNDRRVSVRFSEEEARILGGFAVNLNIPLSKLIRTACREFSANYAGWLCRQYQNKK